MPISNGRNLAKLLGSSANIRSQYVAPVESGSSVSALADMDALIAKTGMAFGDQAFVQSNNKLYLYDGTGWYLVATVENAQPTAISGVESVYALASDGTATVITAVSEDPDGFPLTWSYAVTTGSLGSTATVSQTDNVFTITPSTDEANAGEFSITFSVTDGATGVVSAVSAFTLSFGWTVDISQISYDSVQLDVSNQLVNARDVCFSADGTKMYTICTLFDAVFQYTLSTGFNLSTASYDNVSFTFTGGVSNPHGIAFNTDGTKMYVVDRGAGAVLQYSLTTGFDVSTASYDSVSFSVDSQSLYNIDLSFSTDGTKMYLVNMFSPSEIFQYDLSTGFDLSTASYNSVSYSLTDQTSQPSALTLSPNGTKMYVMYQGSGTTTGVIRSYSLSTAFDISTASYDNASISLGTLVATPGYPMGMHFSSDGTKMFILFENSEYVYQYSTGL